MLRVIATESSPLFDILLSLYSPEKKNAHHIAEVYRKKDTVYLLLKKPLSIEVITWIASEFLPDRFYLPYFGYSVDQIHEVGDVIVPNVFFKYSPKLETTTIDKDNREWFIEETRFLETIWEQKDYYVEDFWLSVWGIMVSSAPDRPSQEMHEKLMLAYEGDVYIPDDVFPRLDTLTEDQIPGLLFAAIIEWKKHSKYTNASPQELAVRNIMTTIELLEADSTEEK